MRAELTRRHAELLAATADRPAAAVLDLSTTAGRHRLAAMAVPGSPPPDPGRFEVVISVAGLARFADLGAALAAVASILAPTGQLLAVEAGYRPGPLGLALSSVGALLPPARGVHLARDVPATVRSVGLSLTDVRRFSVPTPLWPLRQFVSLRAVPTPPAPLGDARPPAPDDTDTSGGGPGAPRGGR